jgi:hypothetical protein
MRVLTALAVFTLVGGCTLLDQFELNGPQPLDPNKVYLGTSRVTDLNVRELDRYGCVGTALICEHRGIGFDCRCL